MLEQSHNEVMALAEEGRAANIVYTDFSKTIITEKLTVR